MPKIHIRDEGAEKALTFDLDEKTVFIGRSKLSDIQVKDFTVSRKHLKILREGKIFLIEDLNSTNGTYVNGDRIEPGQAVPVDENDTVTIGKTFLNFGGTPTVEALPKTSGSGIQLPEVEIDERQLMPKETERRSLSSENLEFIENTSDLLKKTLDVNEILEKILGHIFDILPRVDRAAIVLFEDKHEQIRQLIARSRRGQLSGAFQYSNVLLNRVKRDRKAIKVSNTFYETPVEQSEKTDSWQVRSALCVPMFKNAHIRGGIYLESPRGFYDGFRKEDYVLLHKMSDLVGATIEKASLLLN
ncbi:MAG: FHA domain-containing protein [Desulfobacteraceae bacterium]|nr:MAG: FHA domain-containing protein [Desulfobacteraceae bacterium]